jgi:predicted membrane protein
MTLSTERSMTSTMSPRMVLGIGFVLFGGLLLLDRLDIVQAGYVLRLWPVILIAIGLMQFFNPRRGASGEHIFPVAGVIWIAIGGVLLLNSLHIVRVSLWELFWPAVLIAVGVRLITRTGPRERRRHRRFRDVSSQADDAFAQSGSGDQQKSTSGVGEPLKPVGDSLDTGGIVAVLGGVHRVSAAVPFRGTEVTAFMGGAKIDLRQAIIAPGEEAALDLFVVIGGCELLVPPHWIVSAPVVAVMGGVEDKRLTPQPTVVQDATASTATPPRLVIRGVVMMGGVTLRS